jgi:hypothetical protein
MRLIVARYVPLMKLFREAASRRISAGLTSSGPLYIQADRFRAPGCSYRISV